MDKDEKLKEFIDTDGQAVYNKSWAQRVLEWAAMSAFDPHNQVAIIWGVEDVREMTASHLTHEQCMEVLKHVEEHHDATMGVSWGTIDATITLLFGEPDA